MPITSEPKSTMITKHHDALKGSKKKRLGQHDAYLKSLKRVGDAPSLMGTDWGYVLAVDAPRVASFLPVGSITNIYSPDSRESRLYKN
jgi:hypothetical protein